MPGRPRDGRCLAEVFLAHLAKHNLGGEGHFWPEMRPPAKAGSSGVFKCSSVCRPTASHPEKVSWRLRRRSNGLKVYVFARRMIALRCLQTRGRCVGPHCVQQCLTVSICGSIASYHPSTVSPRSPPHPVPGTVKPIYIELKGQQKILRCNL